MQSSEMQIAIGVFSVIFMLFIGFIFRNHFKKLKRGGLIGVFLFCFISGISIFSPAGAVISILGGRHHNPFLVGIIAAAGCIAGEILAYRVGSAGGLVVPNSNIIRILDNYIDKYGFLTILVATMVPSPLLNIVAGIAGYIRYPFLNFVVASFGGNWIQFTLLAHFGSLTKHLWKT
jgi:membrane protein DedA with SNARE-associated domain